MQDKTKNIIITIGFVGILICVFISNLLVKDNKISTVEKRRLEQFPSINLNEIITGKFTEKFEKYTTDQFIKRDLFRSIKSIWSMNVFKQKDNNKLYLKDNAIYKIEYPLKEKNIEKSAEKIMKIYEKNMKNMNVYYAIIPDKNYYLNDNEILKMDYDRLKQIMENKLENLKYIDIWNELNLNDYYKTDLHWKQENLSKVVEKIENDMQISNSNKISYSKIEIDYFYGTYYGELGLNLPPDKLHILTNKTLENCYTYNYETKTKGKIYQKNNSTDLYDIYLSGATALITLENPNAKTNRELLLFRDSFGSSLAPLLTQNYKKITLIDLRYISSNLLINYIDFENQDVLFLYSTVILNQNVFK